MVANEALTLIPPDAVVAAEDRFAAHLARPGAHLRLPESLQRVLLGR